VEVLDPGEELLKGAKFSVRIDLLQVRLREPARVRLVEGVGAAQDTGPAMANLFAPDDRPMALVLRKLQPVRPGLPVGQIDLDVDCDIRLSPRMQGTDL